MKKNVFKIIFISFFLFLIYPFNVKADNGYTIENYDVKINVNENNVYNITEIIDVHFNSARHGINRKIPIKNTNSRTIDNKNVDIDIKAKIENIDVIILSKTTNETIKNMYKKTKENNYLNLQIGNADEYADEYTTYTISYDYDLGDDNIEEFDDVYFNIIGTEWDTTITNGTFEITMPKSFDDTKLNFTIGKYGAGYNEDIIYSVDNNVIKGYIKKHGNDLYSLYPYEGLTIRLELEEGYFTNERKVIDPTFPLVIGLIIFLIIVILISTLLFLKYGYRKKELLVPEYIVPDDLTPAEIGYLYDGSLKSNQIVSLIIYLANKGYLEIIENNKNDFSFKKLKEIDDNESNYVKTTFKGLFKNANKDGIVKKSDLKEKFYTTLSNALSQLSKTHKIYNISHYLSIAFYLFMIFVIIFTIPILISFSTYRLDFYYSVFKYTYYLIVFITIIFEMIYLVFSKKREEDATKYYNKIRGFKEYIKVVEKDKLETLVKDNPNYFYDILPYAYVLGVSSIWAKKFESITIKPPTWYVGSMYNTSTGMFNINTFNNSLTKTLAQTSTTMSSRPYESTGGYSGGGSMSGGGGFSGGGSGGGGGSSW